MEAAPEMTPRGKGSATAGVLLILAYLAIVLTPLTLAWLLAPRMDDPLLRRVGMMFALVAVPILILQAVTAARLRAISQHYGFDMVMRFHKGMAALALVLLLCHPLLMAAGSGNWGLITRLDLPWTILLGKLALLLLLVQGVTSLYQRHLLNYERWRWLHQEAVLIWLFGWTHSFLLGEDVQVPAIRLLWVLAALAAFGFYLYHKVYVPAVTRRRSWEVTSVTQETHNVWTVALKPPPGVKHFAYWPGQFRFIALLRPGRPFDGEEHHFTISSSPTVAGEHTSTIKESGDFTRTIGQTKPGDRARVEGAFGRFSHALYPNETDLVFIAGGIGITPLMSMLRYLRDTGDTRSVVLLYANRTAADIVFREELAQMEAAGVPQLRVVHILSEADDGWTGEKGVVSRDLIARACGDITGKAFYVCGPPRMMDSVERDLAALHVPAHLMHSERFYL